MSSRYVGANIGQKVVDFIVKNIPRKKKVSPDITKVKKFTDKRGDRFGFEKAKTPTERANFIRKRESIKRMDKVEGLKTKREEGIKASKEIKKMVATGTAKKVGRNIYHKNVPEKKATGGRVGKMGGGMMGRRMGYSQGSKGKIPTTPKEKSLAKLAPPRDRITFGDVVTGRTKGKRMQASVGGGADTGRKPKKRGNPAVVIKEEPMRDRMKQPLKRKKP
jgi:hypothetical protein